VNRSRRSTNNSIETAPGSEAASEAGPLDAGQGQPSEGRFDHYALVRGEDGAFEELGRGARGVTYRALDSVLGHAVALKVLDAHRGPPPRPRALLG
jgi:hypothetical protein